MSLFNLLFSSLSKLWYVEVRISRSVSVSPLEFEITGVDCTCLDEPIYVHTSIIIFYLYLFVFLINGKAHSFSDEKKNQQTSEAKWRGLTRRIADKYEANRISKAKLKRAQRKVRAKASPTELSSSDLSCFICNRQFRAKIGLRSHLRANKQ